MAEVPGARLLAFARRRQPVAPDASAVDPRALTPPALAAARVVWARRVVNETTSVEVAARLRVAATAAKLGPEADAALERLEDDEARHVTLARTVLAHLGDNPPSPSVTPPLRAEPSPAPLVRLVLTGLAICETVSAARFVAVRRHTDLPVYRSFIELFLGDEAAHGELGFTLLPVALGLLDEKLGAPQTAALVAEELQGTLRHLDKTIGLDLERRGGPPRSRAQPSDNPGVVEPAVDAIAFYEAIHGTILPRLAELGLPAREAWATRWSAPVRG
jgi:hypothetical protein